MNNKDRTEPTELIELIGREFHGRRPMEFRSGATEFIMLTRSIGGFEVPS